MKKNLLLKKMILLQRQMNESTIVVCWLHIYFQLIVIYYLLSIISNVILCYFEIHGD